MAESWRRAYYLQWAKRVAVVIIGVPLAHLALAGFVSEWWVRRSRGYCDRGLGALDPRESLQVLVPGNCHFPEGLDWWFLPAATVAALMIVWVAACLVSDWSGGPPQWASELAGFGFGSAVTLSVWGGAWVPIDRTGRQATFGSGWTGVDFLIVFGGGAAAFLGGLWLGTKVGKFATARLSRGGASGAAVMLGSGVSVVVGVGVGMLLVAALLIAIMVYAAVVAMLYLVGGVMFVGFVSAVR